MILKRAKAILLCRKRRTDTFQYPRLFYNSLDDKGKLDPSSSDLHGEESEAARVRGLASNAAWSSYVQVQLQSSDPASFHPQARHCTPCKLEVIVFFSLSPQYRVKQDKVSGLTEQGFTEIVPQKLWVSVFSLKRHKEIRTSSKGNFEVLLLVTTPSSTSLGMALRTGRTSDRVPSSPFRNHCFSRAVPLWRKEKPSRSRAAAGAAATTATFHGRGPNMVVR